MSEKNAVAEPTSATGFLNELRGATTQQHVQLENSRLSELLLNPDSGIAGYVKYLSAMKQVVSFCESIVFPEIQNVISDLDSRRKIYLIEEDLNFLSGKVDVPAMPAFQPVKSLISTPFALGYMYVIEGSVLGGRMIIKQLSQSQGISETEGGKYFSGYGSDTGKLWKSFLNILTQYEQEHHCRSEIINGANHAFESIYNYFESVAE